MKDKNSDITNNENKSTNNMPDSLEHILAYARENLDSMVQMQASMAIVLKAKFDALTLAGFTQEQAMQIINSRGIMP